VNTHQTTVVADNSLVIANRAASFADFELLYEINMAQKIFFKPPQSTIN
jgi:hypothetical protein